MHRLSVGPGAVLLNNYAEHVTHSSNHSCLGSTRMGGVGKAKRKQGTNCECSQHKSYKAKKKKPPFPQTTLTHLLRFILLKTLVVTSPLLTPPNTCVCL